eukprot:TRINITY_DN7938_c0_g1_i2.p1 TRINITY_DN7938_c0_g1~~TRINITY_DN7938_c0_g1_i2.p1  ORF type:complete len:388 (+),score=108.87 TRINITY_DN7938_c0_g1_i2:667-1830(+)
MFLKKMKMPFTYFTSCAAAKGGQLETLKWLRENGAPFDFNMNAQGAAKNGHLDIILYLEENSPDSLNVKDILSFAKFGHWKIFEWAKKYQPEKINWNQHMEDVLSKSGNLEMLEYFKKNGAKCKNLSSIMGSCDVEMVKWAMDNGFKPKKEHMFIEDPELEELFLKRKLNPLLIKDSKSERFEQLKEAHSAGMEAKQLEKYVVIAAKYGNIKMLKWYHSITGKILQEAFEIAVHFQHVQLIKWIFEVRGSLECYGKSSLQYASNFATQSGNLFLHTLLFHSHDGYMGPLSFETDEMQYSSNSGSLETFVSCVEQYTLQEIEELEDCTDLEAIKWIQFQESFSDDSKFREEMGRYWVISKAVPTNYEKCKDELCSLTYPLQGDESIDK